MAGPRSRRAALFAVAVVLLALVLYFDDRFVALRSAKWSGGGEYAARASEDDLAGHQVIVPGAPRTPSPSRKVRTSSPTDPNTRSPSKGTRSPTQKTSSPTTVRTSSPTQQMTGSPTRTTEAVLGETKKKDDEVGYETFKSRILRFAENVTEDHIKECRSVPVPKLRSDRDCEINLTKGKSIYPDFLDSPKRLKRYSEWKFRNVTYIEDNDWGFTCNKLEIIGGGIWRMLHNPKHKEAETNMVALGPLYSELAWNLDLKFLSRDFPVLINCVECPEHPNVPGLLHCGAIIIDGTPHILDSDDNVFWIENKYWAVDLYWNVGPSELGFHPSMAYYLLPSETLRRSVEKAMLNQTQKIVGVHRRDMENWCYRYIGNGRGEYECHINGEAYPIIQKLLEAETPKKFAEKFYFKPLERQYPWITVCNYTLDEDQLEIFETEWPQVFEKGKKHHLLFTTDKNDVGGDLILMKSPAIERLYRIQDINPDVGCNPDKHRMLFYDMYGLALSDYHMANPLSSCDVTVVHWRRILGKHRDSSYPQPCYHGYYDQPLDFV